MPVQLYSINSPAISSRYNYLRKSPQKVESNSIQSSNGNLLEKYLQLAGKQNLSIVSFGSTEISPLEKTEYPSLAKELVTLPDTNLRIEAFRPTLSDYTKWKISTEATDRVYGRREWHNVDDIEAWMISAETDQFMIVGGLGKVATDLSGSFNRRYAGDDNNNMNIATMLYTYKDEYKLIHKDGKYFYQYGKKLNPKTKQPEPNQIELDYKGSVNVPIYNPNTNRKLQDTEVQIFSAYVGYTVDEKTGKPNQDGTKVLFFATPSNRLDETGRMVENLQIFDIEDANPNSENNKTPYANNKYGTDEQTRMIFFSKAVYSAVRDIKEGRLPDLKLPNTLFINDWHPSAVAPMVRYVGNAEADSGKISSTTGKYLDELNIIDILHNCEHQGLTYGDHDKRTSIFATLFSEYGVDILSNAKSWRNNDAQYNPKDEDKISVMKGESFSCGSSGLMLSDRVVPVSRYYSEELLHSDTKAKGLKDLFNARAFSPYVSTLTPIRNGYTKSLIAPTEKHMTNAVLNQLKKDLTVKGAPVVKTDDIEFKAFTDGNLENKLHNKNEFMKLLKRIHERELSLADSNSEECKDRRYFMYDPKNVVIPELENYKEMPLIVFAGRFDPQKGVGTILKDALWQFAINNVNTPKEKLPLFVIGGKITQYVSYERFKQFKDDLAKADGGKYKDIADRIILFKGYVNTNLLATAGDMFLIPSVFEPCGLTQMEAMAKGTLPIATSTGGLVDTIEDNVDGFRTKAFFEQEGFITKDRLYKAENGEGDKFKTNAEAYNEAIQRAVDLFHNDRPAFEKMQKKAIEKDFSWDIKGGPLDKYIELIKTGKISE